MENENKETVNIRIEEMNADQLQALNDKTEHVAFAHGFYHGSRETALYIMSFTLLFVLLRILFGRKD